MSVICLLAIEFLCWTGSESALRCARNTPFELDKTSCALVSGLAGLNEIWLSSCTQWDRMASYQSRKQVLCPMIERSSSLVSCAMRK